MLKKYTKNDYMNLVGSAIEKALDGKSFAVIFFGSILTESFNRTSDIDVAIYSKEKLTPKDIIKVEEEIEKTPILREVDIIDISTVKDKDFLFNILKGKIWRSSKEALIDLKKLMQSLKK